ncbi:MAG TPA: DUF4397 domain-containing protein [Ktedonobacteraceae bacterium]|nr:DUF4397 domain-containing protein [Ktedonobacteraceae bacterium]
MHVKQSVVLMVRRMLLGVGALALLVVFMAPHVGTASAWSKAFVRVVHASPAAGPVDVYVDGSKLLNDFTFGSVTGYVPVAAGSHRIQVAPDGKGRKASVIDVTVTLSGGTYYTAAALGTTSSGFSLKAFVDNNWVPNNMTKVRVYHLSPDAGPVNVAAGGATVIHGLTYKHASGYLTVAPGAYTFNVTAVDYGVTIPIKAQLEEGNVYSVFAVGLVKGSPSLEFVITAFNSEHD